MSILLAVAQNLMECLKEHNLRYFGAYFIALPIALHLVLPKHAADTITLETRY